MSDSDGSFRFVDRKSLSVLAQLAKAPRFRKVTRVRARQAVPGERVITKVKGDLKESVRIANKGDWVVTNPSGEIYAIPDREFRVRYRGTDVLDVYEACGFCQAFPNPFGEPIEVAAAWGAPQRGGADCFIADTCDEDGILTGEPYLIAADAFAATYRPV